MTFRSSIRFDYRTPLIRRTHTSLGDEHELPQIMKAERHRSISETPVKLKYIKIEDDGEDQSSLLKKTARKRVLHKNNQTNIDRDINNLNDILVRIRKEIIKQKEQYFQRQQPKKERKKIQMKYLRHEGDEEEGRTEEIGKAEKIYYCRRPHQNNNKTNKKYIFKPVWKNETSSPRRFIIDNMKKTQSCDVGIQTEKHVEDWGGGQESVQVQVQKSSAGESSDLGNFFPLIRANSPKVEELQINLVKQSSIVKQSRVEVQREDVSKKKLREFHEVVRTRPRFTNERARRSFRKIVNVVLFTIYLRTFNERMHLTRKTLFDKYLKNHLKATLVDLKKVLLDYSRPFFEVMMDKSNFNYHQDPNDFPALKIQKIKAVQKLVNLELQALEPCIQFLVKTEKYAQLFYFLCKHGNYSCLHSIHTAQELNLMCISPTQGYISASYHLQKSVLISFLLVKMLLYNIFFSTTIEIPIRSPIKRHAFRSNVALIGNVLYQLLIDLQDELLEHCPSVYTVGNWTKLQHRFNFKVADDMTVREGIYQTNQLISGLMDRNMIKEVYGTKEMQSEKSAIRAILQQVHGSIRKYHLKVREQCFIK